MIRGETGMNNKFSTQMTADQYGKTSLNFFDGEHLKVMSCFKDNFMMGVVDIFMLNKFADSKKYLEDYSEEEREKFHLELKDEMLKEFDALTKNYHGDYSTSYIYAYIGGLENKCHFKLLPYPLNPNSFFGAFESWSEYCTSAYPKHVDNEVIKYNSAITYLNNIEDFVENLSTIMDSICDGNGIIIVKNKGKQVIKIMDLLNEIIMKPVLNLDILSESHNSNLKKLKNHLYVSLKPTHKSIYVSGVKNSNVIDNLSCLFKHTFVMNEFSFKDYEQLKKIAYNFLHEND